MHLANAAAPAGLGSATPESLGRELRKALNVSRLLSLSVHNAQGDAVWLSEGALGPDEHAAALDGMAALGLERGLVVTDRTLDDSRSACFLALHSPRQDLIGVAMLILDGRMTAKRSSAKVATPQVKDVLHRLARLIAPPSPAGEPEGSRPSADAPAAPLDLAMQTDETMSLARAVNAGPEPQHFAASTIAQSAQAAVRASAAVPPTHFMAAANGTVTAARGALVHAPEVAHSAPDAASTPTPEVEASLIADVQIAARAEEETVIAPRFDTSDLLLVVQQLLKLRSGGRTRRFEVLMRSRKDPAREAVPLTLVHAMTSVESGSVIDRHVLSQLVQWLAANRDFWEVEPASFSINLASDTLRDAGFLRFAASLLEEAKVAPQVVGFEIPERACIEHPEGTRRFVEGCEKLGCYVILDDFTMHSDAVPFLASAALRVVKLDAKLTGAALNDKLAQAIVIAISQASKVLGVHCVVKRIDSTMARQWFAAIGIDFAQGFALERPQSLQALAAAAKKKPR